MHDFINSPSRPGPFPSRPILVFGYGNPGCQDDGAGVILVEKLEKQTRQYVDFIYDFQLNFEYAEDIARHEKVIFVDASVSGPEPFLLTKVAAAANPCFSFTSHYLSPETLLAFCYEHFHTLPEAWMVGIRIYQWEINKPISSQAIVNTALAGQYISRQLDDWELAYNKSFAQLNN